MDRNLSQGMSGTDVRTAQGYLNFHLGPPDLLIEDGIFGPVTREHTVAFQRRANLVTDGIIGPLTRAALLAPTSWGQPLRRSPGSAPDSPAAHRARR